MGPSPELETYRTLRLGMAASGVLLLVAVVFVVWVSRQVPGSVSATYYGLITSIFVGTLVSVGLALVAVKGRPGWENGLMDAAGVLIPMVALVPTPIEDSSCPTDTECVPIGIIPALQVNVSAYLAVGAIALGYLWLRRWREGSTGHPWARDTTTGVAAVSALWGLTLVVFAWAQELFLTYAHYVSAIGFFVILILVVFINARSGAVDNPAVAKPKTWYRRQYNFIAWGMVLFVGTGGFMFWWTRRQNPGLLIPTIEPFPVIFWVEVALLILFIYYWIIQTTELWNETVPGENP